jgi:predicted neuraminidase
MTPGAERLAPPARDRWLLLVGTVTVFALLYARIVFAPVRVEFVPPSVLASLPARGKPLYEVRKVTSGATKFAHSASAVEVLGGGVRAFWFGGSREGATDAAIYSAVYEPLASTWANEAIVATPARLQRDLKRWVRKVGNPVVVRDQDSRLRLFVVSVTAGGWAASSINTLVSDDEGASWGRARRLVASPFLNLSTLVKGAPLLSSDEDRLLLPAYHELAAKFGELLHVGENGQVLDKRRLSWGDVSLQPVIVPRNAREAVGFMRYSGPPPARVLAVRSTDGGRSWSAPEKTALPNPNSGVDALRLLDGSLLLAFNDSEDGRNDLSLAHSRDDGRTWKRIHRVEHVADANAEFSYPFLMRTSDGEFHLLYTANKAEIRHARFNRAWLNERL